MLINSISPLPKNVQKPEFSPSKLKKKNWIHAHSRSSCTHERINRLFAAKEYQVNTHTHTHTSTHIQLFGWWTSYTDRKHPNFLTAACANLCNKKLSLSELNYLSRTCCHGNQADTDRHGCRLFLHDRCLRCDTRQPHTDPHCTHLHRYTVKSFTLGTSLCNDKNKTPTTKHKHVQQCSNQTKEK